MKTATPRMLVAALVTLALAQASAAQRILLLTGANNHDWKSTTPHLESALKSVPHFQVSTFTTPSPDAPDEVWQTNHPVFKEIDAVVMNWTDFGKKSPVRSWMNDFVSYVTNGGALVIVHAASLENHPNWPEIAGLGWHGPAFGDRITVASDGKVIRTPKGQGTGSGHGPPFSWEITMRSPAHPISAGLPIAWQHAEDELWHGTRGPAQNLEVIATALSPISKANEPVMWTVRAGKGRVFVTLLGHHAAAMQSPGFRHTLVRGLEWVITGKVDLPVPPDFPKPADKP